MTGCGFAEFNALSAELSGSHLVEASAGTGKTYGIAVLVLRAALELPWSKEQEDNALRHVLAVTFTRAATAELGERVRKFFREALAALGRPEPPAPDAENPVSELVRLAFARGEAGLADRRRVLEQALNGMDEAAVHTIHGFCERVLSDYALETGASMDSVLVADRSPLVREVAADFYRREVAHAAGAAGAVLWAWGKPDLDGWAEFLNANLAHPAMEIRCPRWDAGEVDRRWAELARIWSEDRGGVLRDVLAPIAKKTRKGGATVGDRVEALARKMDDHFQPEFGASSTVLRPDQELFANLKKHSDPCGHPLAGAVAGLLEVAERAGAALKASLWDYYRLESARRKEERGVLHFDDLLAKLHSVIGQDGQQARTLRSAMRKRYRMVLIDEFQDTDPVQYDIFRYFFAGGDDAPPLFFIGDPKQSIYEFRGADIYSYLAAAGRVDHRHTMPLNRRSSPEFVAACNALYDMPGRSPFLFDEISYTPVTAAPSKDDGPLTDSRGGPAPALVVWGADGGAPESKTSLKPRIVRAVGDEVQRVLGGGILVGGRRLGAGDVAVLVQSHADGESFRTELSRRGIPAVTGRPDDVFSTDEAEEWRLVLAALSEPSRMGLVRAALLTRMLGQSLSDIAPSEESASCQEAWAARFRSWAATWRSGGFGVMAERLLRQAGVRSNLLSSEDGVRRLTNAVHLADVIQRWSSEGVRDPLEVLSRLSARIREAGSAGREEDRLRVESDEKAVRILTVHASKGLEFDAVFCPFLASSAEPKTGEAVAYHERDDSGKYKIILELYNSDPQGKGRSLALRERLAEQLRLFYVALTRARKRAYLVSARVKRGSGLPNPEGEALDSAQRHMLADARERMEGRGLSVEFATLPDPGPARWVAETLPESVDEKRKAPGGPRVFGSRIPSDWGIQSFTRLSARHAHSDREETDRDAVDDFARVEDALAERVGIFAFPRGTLAGSALHEILEKADFAAGEPELAEASRPALRRYGLLAPLPFRDRGRPARPTAPPPGTAGVPPATPITRDFPTPSPVGDWAEVLARFFHGAFHAELDACGDLFRLCDIPRADRAGEWGFQFRLGRTTASAVLRAAGVPAHAGSEDAVRGLMTGSVDLVFRRGGRYFIVDWKSNDLGPEPSAYGSDAMERAMRSHGYDLQLLIYSVALRRHLALRTRGGFDFARDFGGAFYLFLRGMLPGARTGILFRKPDADTVRRLDAVLEGGL